MSAEEKPVTTTEAGLLLRELVARQAMGYSERFEADAEAFYRETHLLPPGKSVPVELYSSDYETRREREWTEWNRKRSERWTEAMRQAADAIEHLSAERDDLEGDAATLRGYINTYRETPTMTASNRDHWKRRAEKAEADLADYEAAGCKEFDRLQAEVARLSARNERANVNLKAAREALSLELRGLAAEINGMRDSRGLFYRLQSGLENAAVLLCGEPLPEPLRAGQEEREREAMAFGIELGRYRIGVSTATLVEQQFQPCKHAEDPNDPSGMFCWTCERQEATPPTPAPSAQRGDCYTCRNYDAEIVVSDGQRQCKTCGSYDVSSGQPPRCKCGEFVLHGTVAKIVAIGGVVHAWRVCESGVPWTRVMPSPDREEEKKAEPQPTPAPMSAESVPTAWATIEAAMDDLKTRRDGDRE